MLFLVAILGGLLIMMGQHARSEALFYYFRLEDQVPETHLLRLIDKHISFGFVREKLKESYSDTGRPSIDPALRANISETLPVVVINEQGEEEKNKDEQEFSWFCLRGRGWRGTKRRRA